MEQKPTPEQMERAREAAKEMNLASPYLTAIAQQSALTAIIQSDHQQAKLLAHADAMAGALEPFVLVAEHDIGTDEADKDRHQHMDKHNYAPRLTVGDFRRAATAYRQYQEGRKDA